MALAASPAKGSSSKGSGSKGAKPASKPATAKANTSGYNSPLYNPSATLSGRALGNAANQIATSETQGPIDQLKGQIAQNNQNTAGEQRTDFGYYLGLANAAKGAVDSANAQGTALQGTLQGIGANTQTQLNQINTNASNGVLGRMTAQGTGGNSLSNLQTQTAGAQNAGTLLSQNAQVAGAAENANLSGETAALGQAGVVAGTNAISALGRSGQISNMGLNSKIADEQDKKGALAATALGQLRTAERNYQIASAGVNIKQQTVNNVAANDQAKNTIAANRNTITAQNDTATQLLKAAGLQETTANNNAKNQNTANANQIRQNYDQGTLAIRQQALAGKAGKPLTASQNDVTNASIGRIIGLIKEAQTTKVDPVTGKTSPTGTIQNEATIKSHLTTGQNPSRKSYAPILIEAAYELLGYGSIDQSTAAALHSLGVRGTTYTNAQGQIAPVTVTPNYRQPAPVAAGNAQIPGIS